MTEFSLNSNWRPEPLYLPVMRRPGRGGGPTASATPTSRPTRPASMPLDAPAAGAGGGGFSEPIAQCSILGAYSATLVVSAQTPPQEGDTRGVPFAYTVVATV